MSRLNGHNSVQHIPNARITRSRRWRINNGHWINILLSCGSPEVVGGGGATPEEDSTWGRLELALIWVALCLRKVAPMEAIMCTGSEARNSSKPRCNKIWCIKTGKKRPCAIELLLWISTKDQMKRVGKLIGAFVTRAYKNVHLSIGMVCKCEMDQMEWQEIQKNK